MKHGSRPNTNRGANGGACRLPPGRTYLSHQGARQRERVFRRSWATIEQQCSFDAATRAARERLLDAVADEPHAEFAALQLGHAALLAANDCRASWADAINHLLNQMEAAADAAAETDTGVGPDGMPPDMKAALARGADITAKSA